MCKGTNQQEEKPSNTTAVPLVMNNFFPFLLLCANPQHSVQMDIYEFLDQHNIPYQRCDHPAVYTCEEVVQHVPADFPGAHTKNLFLRDAKGKRHFLVTVAAEHSVDLKALSQTIGASRLSFASAERLERHLGIAAGAVSLLAVLNDSKGAVEIFVDQALWEAETLRCHPLVNTSTLSIASGDIERFLSATGHSLKVVRIP